VAVAGTEVRRLDGRERRDLLLQLEHDSLGGLLSDTGDRLEEVGVLPDDRALELPGGVAGDDREGHLGPDAADRQKLLEELALARFREAVEVEGVVAHVQVGLEHDLLGAVRKANRARSREESVADSTDVHNQPLGVEGDGPAANARNHRAAPARTASGGARA
jgi:hypothetical protein